MSDTIHIAIPSDDGYWFYAAVAAASAVRSSSLPVHVHVLDGGISDGHRESLLRTVCGFASCHDVSFHALDMERLKRCGNWHGSPVAYSRLFLSELLPDDVDWVVSADADVFFRGDIVDLWKMRDSTVSIQPSRDCPLPPQPYNLAHVAWYGENGLRLECKEDYFCDGLCLVNLKRWREKKIEERNTEFIRLHGDCPAADQTVLNYVLQNDKKLLPRGWGVFSGDENADVNWSKSGCVHFVEDPPWRRWKCTHLMSDLVLEWWQLAELLAAKVGFVFDGYRGCRNRFDYLWRRLAFVFLKRNQWLLRMNGKMWLHLRGTRGIR